MKYFLFFFFCAFFPIFAEDDFDDISKLEITLSGDCEPLTTIADCVNVVSGNFFQMEKDLIGNTIDPISFTRFYDSSNKNETFVGYGYGSQYPLVASEMQDTNHHSYALISERDGFLIPYRSKLHSSHADNRKTCYIDPRLIEKGYTNLSRVETSGLSNFINWRAIHKPEEKSDGWSVQLGDRSQRIYGLKTELSKENRKKMGLPSKVAYLLTEEIKPNGNRLVFNYTLRHGKPYLNKIQTRSRVGNILLNELNISYDHHHDREECQVTSSCGNKVIYKLRNVDHNHKILEQTYSSQKGNIFYGNVKLSRPFVIFVGKPRGQFVKVYYQEKKVLCLLEPLGPNKKIINTYDFYYGDNSTIVVNPLLLVKNFQFDSHHRLTQINYHSSQYRNIFLPPPKDLIGSPSKLLKQECFVWSKKPGEQGWLKAKCVRFNEVIYHLKSFDYDHRGNITREKFYGNLTGKKSETFKRVSETERYCVEYAYTKDGRNLLVEKKTPEGLMIRYDYLQGTNLRTEELQIYNGKIQERIFRDFDDNGQIRRIIQDDGSGLNSSDLTDVTYRKVKTIIKVKAKNTPAYGKPKKIVESNYDFNVGKLKPCKSIVFEYDKNGNEIEQTVLNSQNEFCYRIIKEYDKRQRLKKEVNALGHTKVYQYDENNNIICEELLDSGKVTFFEFDHINRLESKREQHQNGETFITTYGYNNLHQVISEIDAYGNETNYEYDHLGRQTKCIKPAYKDVNGVSIRPTITKEYNPLDQVIASTNENGFVTNYSYNIYGQPTLIIYPDGTHERYVYRHCGWLKQKWLADGTSVKYSYDPKGRILSEKALDAAGNHLKTEEYCYKGHLLQFKKDALGLITQYFYDGAGLKIKEVIGDRLKETHYEYDDFERLIKTVSFCEGQVCQIETKEYDWLNRVRSKTLQDYSGTIYARESYEYDITGNQIKKSIHQSGEKIAVYYCEYNSDNTLKYTENPLHHQTRYFYDHHHANELNQRVQSRLIHDPLGRPVKEVDHANGKIHTKEYFDGDMKVSHTRYNYDAAGNLINQTAKVMIEGQPLREYWIEWVYDCRGRVQSETELPQGKTTCFEYDSTGRLFRKIKPDGVILEYRYDSLGRLEQLSASDQSIDYIYQYDLHDNPILIHDLVNQIVQKRQYDLLDRLIEEEISPGIKVSYDYDSQDRLLKMQLPDYSYVKYSYDAYHLKMISRYFADGQLKYEHACDAYDLFGNLVKNKTPAGDVAYEYDLLGRNVAVRSSSWESEQVEFDPLGNLKKLRQKDPTGELIAHFSYDRFDHVKLETGIENNHFQYDSLGNCVQKNKSALNVNALNQVEKDDQSEYVYDLNGNLIKQTQPPVTYTYDALNRLICCGQANNKTSFTYDAFGRCLEIKDQVETRSLLYIKNKEIGAMVEDKLHEFRMTHPRESSELVFAIELQNEVYFPLQDARYNIGALKKLNGALVEWSRYSVFGKESIYGNGEKSSINPWRFANRRLVAGLTQFQHRYYHPNLMRWLSTDPAGFEEGLNLYNYVRNNPFYYSDPDGRIAIFIPIIEGIIGLTEIILSGPTIGAILGTITGGALGIAVDKACKKNDIDFSQDEIYESPVYNQEQTSIEISPSIDAEGKGNYEQSLQGIRKKPKFCGKELGDDSTKCPGEGFEWRGRGDPKSGKGRWFNPETQEHLHPDFNHPPPIQPHWDYESPEFGEKMRLNLDGTWEFK
jgi:RHS repeat-associated protein